MNVLMRLDLGLRSSFFIVICHFRNPWTNIWTVNYVGLYLTASWILMDDFCGRRNSLLALIIVPAIANTLRTCRYSWYAEKFLCYFSSSWKQLYVFYQAHESGLRPISAFSKVVHKCTSKTKNWEHHFHGSQSFLAIIQQPYILHFIPYALAYTVIRFCLQTLAERIFTLVCHCWKLFYFDPSCYSNLQNHT
jgi:hypothetical protein